MSGPGIVAQFASAQDLIDAVRRLRGAGFAALEAFAPFPVQALDEELGHRPSRLPLVVLACGAFGLIAGFGLQYYGAVIDYPINIGGRPLNSWPAFLPTTFEMTMLWAVIAAVFGALAMSRLPRLSHPIFAAPGFEQATQDGFFLAIHGDDPRFDAERVRWLLERFAPLRIEEVEL
jgi:hypothetical protein